MISRNIALTEEEGLHNARNGAHSSNPLQNVNVQSWTLQDSRPETQPASHSPGFRWVHANHMVEQIVSKRT